MVEMDDIPREPGKRPTHKTRAELVRTCCATVSAFATLTVLLHVYNVL
jgi:hypothetical protein